MSENMVRTQVYLPRDIYQRLQRRAANQTLTLAAQIREALDDYLRHVAVEDDEHVMSPDDPLRQLIGCIATNVGDGSINHDKYIYRRDWADPPPEPTTATRVPAMAVKEPRSSYQSKKSKQGKRRT
jgi:hypothetical protein